MRNRVFRKPSDIDLGCAPRTGLPLLDSTERGALIARVLSKLQPVDKVRLENIVKEIAEKGVRLSSGKYEKLHRVGVKSAWGLVFMAALWAAIAEANGYEALRRVEGVNNGR